MPDAYEKFLQDLRRRKGLDLTGYKRPQMERRINSLMRSLKVEGYDTYLDLMEKEIQHWLKFLDTLTINVSEFYRNPNQWELLESKIIPELITKTPFLKLWSAGCSTGEEPYSLAMLMINRFHKVSFTLTASDIDDEVINKAKAGVYNDKAVANLPKQFLSLNFTQQGTNFVISEDVKRRVKYVKRNLLRDPFDRSYDLILCRNVVIYFTEESKAELYRKFHDALRIGGILFTGSTEQIFQPREIGFNLASSFFYRREG
ncbi:MAG: chemotaxis protein CheR [Firmicutes bacterium HGW-Firmicutes-8]|nr:MAG: chemotaxis protein CheR [Firmicutes bacterium HGW-Firmicutes-8]